MLVVIKTHDGETYETEIEDFDLASFIEDVNENPHKMIQFGGIGILKHLIKIVDTTQGGHIFDGQEG